MSEQDKQRVLEAIRILMAVVLDTSTPFHVKATGALGEGDKRVRGFLKVVRKPSDRPKV